MFWGQLLPPGTGVELGRVAYLLAAFTTHAVVASVLVAIRLGVRPWVGAVAGLAPDLDFLLPAEWGFPLVHRGLTHSPAALVAVLLVGCVLDADEDLLAAVGVGYLSHLVIDSLTPKGVLWLYPLSSTGIGFDLGGHSPPVTLAVWTACGVIYTSRRGLPDPTTLLEYRTADEPEPEAQ